MTSSKNIEPKDLSDTDLSKPVKPKGLQRAGKGKSAYEIAAKPLPKHFTPIKWVKKHHIGQIALSILKATSKLLPQSPIVRIVAAITGGAVTYVSTPSLHSLSLLTQNQTTMPFHFNVLTLILLVAGLVFGHLSGYFQGKKVLHAVFDSLQEISADVKKAISADSPGGRKIEKSERQAILHGVVAKAENLAKILLNKYL